MNETANAKVKKRFSLRAILLTALLSVLGTLGAAVLAAWLVLGTDGLAVVESVALINTRFVGDYDPAAMADAALTGMVSGLGDRWSVYFSAQDYAAQNQYRANAYVGVGFTYLRSEAGDAMEIQTVTPGSPAETAGLCPGERVVGVDGTALTPENFEELTGSIPGEPGKRLTLTVEDAQGVRREVPVTLAQVENDPVSYELLEGDIGYVRIENFFQRSAQGAKDAVEELKSQGARALLFDVRNDPGGYVSELVSLLDYLLPEGPIFTEHTKNGPVRVVSSDEAWVELPMAVLLNGESYSAAELFAAQLRESVQAPLIGEATCGKGYYQQALELVNGGALNISTGVYGTGGGTSLIGVGLTPDIVESDWDAQLARAVERLEAELD